MLGIFSGLKDYVPFKKSADSCKLEGPVSRLNYRFTTSLFLGCCLLVTSIEWIGNDSKIACVMEGPDDSWTIPKNVINTYCYVMSTFTLPRHSLGEVGQTVVQPGVGEYNRKKDNPVHAAYYQWVPFMLFLQAAMFYFPHLLLKHWEGGKVHGIITGLNQIIIDKAERVDKQRILAQYFVDNLNSHNVWAVKMFICQIFSFANVVFNIFFIDIFLGGEFSTYGLAVAEMMEMDSEARIDPMSAVFPKVTKCTYRKFGPSGTLQYHDSLCVLPINIINEKIYVFLWFWLVILSVITGLALLYHLFVMLTPPVRNMLLKSHAAHQKKVSITFTEIYPHLQVGDWKLLHILGSNMEPLVFGEFIQEIAVQMKENQDTDGVINKPLLTTM